MGMLSVSVAHGEILHERDGITLEGTARIEAREAGVCQVSADGHAAEAYERIKANHGQPLHVWRLDFAARNSSGRRLEHLTAHFSIASEAPPCTSWSGPLGDYAKPVQWANSFQVLHKPDGMKPDQEVTDTVFVLAFRDRRPAFESWNLDFRFADEPSSEVEPGLIAPAFIVVAVPAHARVSLLNTVQPYRRRMPLEPGRYQVEVSAPGYRTLREWVDHQRTWPHRIELERLPGRSDRSTRPALSTAGQLPPEIQMDLNLRKAEQALRDSDAATAREALERLFSLQQEHGLEPEPEEHFRYAQAWEAAGVPDRAMEAAVRYLQLRGQEAEHYTEALDLMNRAESAQTGPVAATSGEGHVTPTVSRPHANVAAEPARSQPAAQASDCEKWGTSNYFGKATVADVKACLEAGADLMRRDAENLTPLHRAAESGENPEVIEAMVAAGASLEARSKYDETPLHSAARHTKYAEIIRALIDAGASLEARNSLGYTPLHRAASYNENPEIIRALVNAGANPNAQDKTGKRPMDLTDKQADRRILTAAGGTTTQRTGSSRSGAVHGGSGPAGMQGCSETALKALPRLYSSIAPATLEFGEMMVLTRTSGPLTTRQWLRFRASVSSITYTIVRAKGSAKAGLATLRDSDFEDDIPIRNPGPHTTDCRRVGQTLYWGNGSWTPRRY